MKWNGLPIIIMGTGSMSKETKFIIDEINRNSYNKVFDFLGYISESINDNIQTICKDEMILSEVELDNFISKFDIIGVAIPFGFPKLKEKIYKKLSKYNNIVYPNIISPKANIVNIDSIKFGKGNIISAGATLTFDITLGDFNLININSTVGHDVVIDNYCVINPQASISGNVHIKSCAMVGAGATIKQGITIGENSTVGLGGFSVKDIEDNDIVICEPARSMNRRG